MFLTKAHIVSRPCSLNEHPCFKPGEPLIKPREPWRRVQIASIKAWPASFCGAGGWKVQHQHSLSDSSTQFPRFNFAARLPYCGSSATPRRVFLVCYAHHDCCFTLSAQARQPQCSSSLPRSCFDPTARIARQSQCVALDCW